MRQKLANMKPAALQQSRDNDNENDTLREVPHPSNEGLTGKSEGGHDTTKKNLLYC